METKQHIDDNTTIEELCSLSKFVAIDFETANAARSSACSIGLVFSDGVKIVGRKHFYTRPIPAWFDGFNVSLHGITEEMIAGAPTFYELWPEISAIGKLDLVAHNAAFDSSVLRNSFWAGSPLRNEDTSIGNPTFYCTMKIARKAYTLKKYKLKNLCKHLCVALENHHDALADAEAVAEIVHAMLKKADIQGDALELNPLSELSKYYLCKPKNLIRVMSDNEYHYKRVASDDIQAYIQEIEGDELSIYDDDHSLDFFQNKKAIISGCFNCITRDELTEKLRSHGAIMTSGISKVLNFFVVGDAVGPRKFEKVQQLLADGHKITILTEAQVLSILDELES